jgi:hypothetical protein
MSKKWALMALALVVVAAVLFSGCIHRGPGWHPGYKFLYLDVTPDGSGGVFVGWRDEGTVYIQRVDSQGNLCWGQGLVLNTAPSWNGPYIVRDNSDGIIALWNEQSKDIDGHRGGNYAQRINSEGEFLWGQGGKTVPGLGCMCNGVPDGSGGAIIASAGSRIRVQRIDQDGNCMWSEEGVTISNTLHSACNPSVLADGSGGAIIVWPDNRAASGRYDIYTQRISPEGEILWQEGGIPVCAPQYAQTTPKIVSDGSDGAIVAWLYMHKDVSKFTGETPLEDYRQACVQRLSPDGKLLWEKEGIQLGALPITASSHRIAMTPDNTGGAIVGWMRQVQRVNSEGEVKWTEPVNLSIGVRSIIDDGFGGVIIAGDSPKEYGHSLHAQRINSDGEAMWGEGGVQLFTGPQADFPGFMYSVVSDSSGGAILIANTGKYVAYWDTLYAQRIDSQGKVLWGDEGVQVWPE